jgi:glycosyltransferase involved in cell wall biosynthesis
MPWLLAVAMMRPGDKLASYRLLAEALRLAETPCQLLVVGDGPARAAVERSFAARRAKVAWLGQLTTAELPEIYAAADLLVWPAINEAFGMALLEAQSCGCPVVAGASGGVPAIVADRETGWLSPTGNAAALAADIDFALGLDLGPVRLAARRRAWKYHDIGTAADRLRATFRHLGVG